MLKPINQLDSLYREKLFNLKADSWQGRRFTSNGKTYLDFTNTNYLGFDFESSLIDAANKQHQCWSNIAGWSRMEVDPIIYDELENRIANFLHCQKVHLSHTITITNFSILPSIAQKGVIFVDKQLHHVVMEACYLAKAHGAQIVRFKHQDLNHLEYLLKKHQAEPDKLIVVDGVYSISTELCDIENLQYLCNKYEAWLYVDDAHGFGILGENPTEDNPYGMTGNGIVNYYGGNYDKTFYVSSFGKAFCTSTAFATIPNFYERNVKATSMQYLFSAPPLPSIIGTVHAVLDLNAQKGEQARIKIQYLADTLAKGLKQLGYRVDNVLKQPVVYVQLGDYDDLVTTAKTLWGNGIIAGLRAHPLVPKSGCGLRFALTALHELSDINYVLDQFNTIS